MELHLILLISIISYLLGSIPFGLLIAKVYNIKDLRGHGSGNIGATNAWRVGGKKIGIMTFACDTLKSLVPVFIINYHYGEVMAALSGFMAVIGHVFPIWLRFKGGKGVATLFGMLFGSNLLLALIVATTWGAIFKFSRISSLAAIVSMGALIIASFFLSQYSATTWIHVALVVLIIWRHQDNIIRMINKSEK